MKRFLVCVLLLFAAIHASATITAIAGTTNHTGTTPLTLTYGATTGRLEVAFVPVNSGGVFPFCQDNNLNTLLPGPTISNSSTSPNVSLSVFYGYASAGATSYVCRYRGGTSVTGLLEEFTGALSVNPLLSGNTASGTGSSASFSVTTEDNNDVVLCGFANGGSETYSSLSGTSLQSISTAPSAVMFSVGSASPGSVTCSATLSGSSNPWVGIALELRTVTSSPTFSITQITPSGYPTLSPAFGCPIPTGTNSNLSCTLKVPALQSGLNYIFGFTDNLDNGAGVKISLASLYSCGSPPCTAGNNDGNVWTIPSSCNASAWNGTSYNESVGGAYLLQPAFAGSQYITATRTSDVSGELWSVVLFAASGPGSTAVDSINSQSDNTASLSHTMTPSTLTGTDLIIQFEAGGAQAITSPYLFGATYSHFSYAFANSQSSGTAPTWTSTISQAAAGCAIALTGPPLPFLLTVNASGPGSVSSSPAGISSCSNATCTASFSSGTVVTLTETPNAGSEFVSWVGGGCSGYSLTCSVTMSSAQSVTAQFKTSTPQISAIGGIKVQGGVLFGVPQITMTITDSSPLPNCTQSVPFSYTFNVSGGVAPYTWSVASGSLQAGLSLSSAGVLSGICTAASGTASFTIKVVDSASPQNVATKPFQQTVQSGTAPLVLICSQAIQAQNSGVVNTSGTGVTWVSGNNFSNLVPTQVITINSVNYVIQTVNSSTSITLTSSAGTQTSVAYSTNYPTCPNPPTPEVTNSFYSYTFNAIGGTSPYTWNVSAGAIPNGLTLTSSGVLSGFPTAPGTFNFTIQVTDSTTPTPGTATQPFTIVVAGSAAGPQTAAEPQTWVTLYQGGVNKTTGNPCAQTDSSGSCTNNLPIVCNAANNCVHEQLGFGSKDHDATLAGLTAAGCDWTALPQGWYLWVEVAKGTLLSGPLNNFNGAMYTAPQKIQGLISPGCTAAATNTPVGPYSIPVSGSISGNLILGETIKQQVTGAEAYVYFYGCQNVNYPGEPQIDVPPLYPRPCVNGVVPGTTGVIQVGPVQVGQIMPTYLAADSTHTWVGQTSGATFTPASPNGLTQNTDDSTTGWSVCVTPCAGPGNPPSAYQGDGGHPAVILTGQSPNLDGAAGQVFETSASGGNSDALWTFKQGPNDASTNQSYDIEVYPTSGWAELEYDTFLFCAECKTWHPDGQEWMWGSQCKAGHNWQIFDQQHNSWQDISPAISCNLTSNAWNHIVWNVHRNASDTGACGGEPCEYYDQLAVNGTTLCNPCGVYGSSTLPVGAGWTSNTGWQLQIDIATGSTTVTENFDKASFTSSAAAQGPIANGYFRLTGQCSPGAGSGKNGSGPGTNDTPCNNLTDQIPCFHNLLDSSIINNTGCTNDLPSMYTFALPPWGVNPGPTVIDQEGDNTSLSGFEVTIFPGSNQGMVQTPLCDNYHDGSGNKVNCSGAPTLIAVNCASCFRDHYFGHGWDPGDPAPVGGWGLSQEAVGIANGYPVNPATGHHECPSWAYYSTYPEALNNPPVTITGPAQVYDSGCGDDVNQVVQMHSGGFTADEYAATLKTHAYNSETHSYGNGHGADNLNPTPQAALTPGQINTGGNGMQGPNKVAHVLFRGTAETIFWGGSQINPTNGLARDEEIRDIRTGSDPGYRYLTAGSGNSPLQSGGWGCGQGAVPPGTKIPKVCPFIWGMKKDLEIKYCLRCMIDGFILEYMWPDGQSGQGEAIDARVCSGGEVCAIVDANGVPLTQVNDVRFTNGIVRHAAGFFQVSPRALGAGSGGGTSQGVNRTLLQNILAYDTDQNQWGSTGGPSLLYGSAGNTNPNCTAVRTSGKVTLTCPNAPYSPSKMGHMDVDTNGTGSHPTTFFADTGERQDLLDGGSFQMGITCADKSTTCFGATYAAMIAVGLDCTSLPCVSATPGYYAPMCTANGNSGQGLYSQNLQIGSACTNCGSGHNQQCPPFGASTVGGTSPYAATIICDNNDNVSLFNCLPNGQQASGAIISTQSLAFNLLDVSPGDIVVVTNCKDTSFNTPKQPATPNIYADPATNPATLSVIYPNAGADASTTGCQINNGAGWQKNFIVNHFALYTTGKAQITATSHGYGTQMENNVMTNSIFYFGGAGNGLVCTSGGCSTKEASNGAYSTWDYQSNQIHHNVFILPTTLRANLYSAVCGTVPCQNLCAGSGNGGGNCIPPNVGCATTQTLDGNGNPTCLGLTGFLSGLTSFPNTDCTAGSIASCPFTSPPFGSFDYHGLSLCSSCSPGAGHNFFLSTHLFAGPATDGFQLGPCLGNSVTSCLSPTGSMLSIDQALTRNLYVCTGSCGLGPWPD